MSYTKPKLYTLALSALLLSEEISDVETNTSNEVRILNTHWDAALESTLQDMDLDATSLNLSLELLDTLSNGPWAYVYKYPNDCAFMRRIVSLQDIDNRSTHISKRRAVYNGTPAIYTNEYQAVIECIPKSVPLATLSAMAGLAVAYKLAFLAAPLIVGKGAKSLRQIINQDYVIAKTEAQETDQLENFNYETDSQRSEWVEERIS